MEVRHHVPEFTSWYFAENIPKLKIIHGLNVPTLILYIDQKVRHENSHYQNHILQLLGLDLCTYAPPSAGPIELEKLSDSIGFKDPLSLSFIPFVLTPPFSYFFFSILNSV